MVDFIGDSGANTLDGGSGNDLIRGLGGDDTINGGAGNDDIFGGGGTNILTGGAGNDTFGIEARSLASNGGSQIHDVQDFTIGEDKIDLSFLNIADFETLQSFLRQDLDDLIIEFENDGLTERFILRDVSFNDISASDFIFNTSTTSLNVGITGRTFTDYVLFGGNGNDTIVSDTGDDSLSGGAGNDEISAGFGTNIVRGGAGNDDINITGRDFFTTNTTIEDFTIGQDQLDVSFSNISTFADLSLFLTQDDDDVVLRTFFDGANETYRFTDTQLSALSASDFIFNTSTADLDVTASGRTFTDYVLFGGAGDDEITAFTGDDVITGGAGDDDIAAGFGTNTVRGGAGNDDFNITGRDFFTTNTTIADFTIGEDQLDVRIFNVADLTTLLPYLSQDGDDVVLRTIFDGASEIYRLQNVLLEDLTESDFIFNDINVDLTVNASGRSSTDYILFGGNGDDVINGSGVGSSFAGDNILNGGAGNDELNGGGDRDILVGGAGADELNGGGSFDQASYIAASTGVNVNLATGEASGDQAVGDTFEDVEGLVGSQFNDVLTGNDIEAGRFDGLGGDDIIVTGEANGNINIANGGTGNDTITGATGRDRIDGGDDNDIIDGQGGNDEIAGGAGDDIITGNFEGDLTVGRLTDISETADGGEGFDTLALNSLFFFLDVTGPADARVFELGDENGIREREAEYSNFEQIQVEGRLINIDIDNLEQGSFSSEDLILTNESEVVQALNFGDTFGLGGDDYILSSITGQTIFGGDGADILIGHNSTNLLIGDTPIGLTGLEGELFRAFQAVFDRAPDEGGFNAFLTEMRLGNLTQEDVISQFVSSAEFQNTFGDLDNESFVEQLFFNVLNRQGDAAGIIAFTGALDAGRSRASVVTEFANSAEFVQLMTQPSAAFATNVIIDPAEAQVFRIFQAVFLRDPDEGGFTAFTNSIQAGVLSVQEITAEFVGSAEFQQTYGDLDNADFVELLFTNVLPGNTDAQGRANFTESLDAGSLTRAGIVAEFVDSFEFVQRMQAAATEFVGSTFSSFNDILSGGSIVGSFSSGDDDFLTGGRGADRFIFNTENGDIDTILDFTPGTDTLDLGTNEDFDSFAEIMAVGTQVGQNTVFDFGGGNELILENVILSELTEADFGLLVMG